MQLWSCMYIHIGIRTVCTYRYGKKSKKGCLNRMPAGRQRQYTQVTRHRTRAQIRPPLTSLSLSLSLSSDESSYYHISHLSYFFPLSVVFETRRNPPAARGHLYSSIWSILPPASQPGCSIALHSVSKCKKSTARSVAPTTSADAPRPLAPS